MSCAEMDIMAENAETTCVEDASPEVEVEEVSEEGEGASSMGSRSSSGTSSPVPPEEQTCTICVEKFKQPRVLSCLHVFCLACLEKISVEKEDEENKLTASSTNSPTGVTSITCPECKQEMALPKGLAGLPVDNVMMNMMDMSAIEDMQIICTSCKAKEKAVARCSDCANFLCSNCVTAHQYMRCFENHKVVSFDELKTTDGAAALHKPLFCEKHPAETLKYVCNTCQEPICSVCLAEDHKLPTHQTERIQDIEIKQVDELKGIIAEARSKVKFCEDSTTTLSNSLSELQMQSDDARSLIKETFQSYKAILDKRQEEVLKELEEMHTKEELSVMEILHNVEKTLERIEDGCRFSDRMLQHGNGTEILLMKPSIVSQLLSLINNTPKPDLPIKMEFITDADKFEEAIKANFGEVVKQKIQPSEPQPTENAASSMHSSFENEGLLPPGILSPNTAASLLTPVSAPDFMGPIPDLQALTLPPIAPLVSGVSVHTINSIASSIQNLAANERSSSRNSYSPAMSDSGISVDAASSSNSSGTNQPIIDMAALSRIGNVTVGAAGQISVNGQLIPGLNVSNVANSGAVPHALMGRPASPATPAPDPNLAGLLNPVASRSPTPQLNELTNLLSQASSLTSMTTPLATQTPSLTPTLPTPGSVIPTPPPGSTGILGVGAGLSLNVNTATAGTLPSAQTPAFTPSPGSSSGASQTSSSQFMRNKMSAMQIRCKFGQLGPGKGQFNSPHGFCLGMDEDIVVADTNNHRVQVFEKTGEFKYQFGIPGREEGQLWYPRKVAVIRHSGKYVVCDRGNERSRMQIFTKSGHFIKKIAIRYIDIVAGLAITHQGHIVAVDSVSPTVFCIAESGDLIKWFDCSDYMREPSDIAVSQREYFVCDFKGHCVVVFNEDGQFLRRIGCENITNYPNGIDISDAGDVLVGDSHGNRFHVAVFQREGSLIGEFECPYVKVSRCCGLKITSEGYIVTLAKNNHHVLVLNTLYIGQFDGTPRTFRMELTPS